LNEILHDLRYSLRNLRSQPAFAAAAIVTLALGIGANVLIFSLVDGVLLEPLPYSEPERLMEVWNTWDGEERGHLAAPELRAYREGAQSLSALAGYAQGPVNISEDGEPERLAGVWAGQELFAVLGVEPILGRGFEAADAVPGATPVVVVSWELWQRRFAARRDLVGDTIRLDGEPTTVVGVLPPDVRLPSDHRAATRTDLWAPLEPQLPPDMLEHWGMHFLNAVARLEPDVELDAARAEMDLVVDRIQASGAAGDNAAGKPSFGVALRPALDEVVGPVRPALLVLTAAVGLVLLIACANVANLQLARGQSRSGEVALRSALGASRGRLVRQLLTESVAVGLIGGALGMGLAVLGLRGLVATAPAGIPRLAEITLDWPLLVFSAALSVFTGLTFGLLPALQASAGNLVSSLRDGSGGAAGHQRVGWRRALVAVEVGLAVVLVVGAGLLVKTFWKLQGVDPGYDTEQVLTLRLSLPESAYPGGPQLSGFFGRLRDRVEALPGVEAAGAISHLPLATSRGDWNFYPEGRVLEAGDPKPRGDWQIVTPGYFSTMGVAMHDGRDLRASDDGEANLVLLVNQPLAERYWPNESPVGQRVRLGGNDDNPHATIVGVVAPIRHTTLASEPVPELYIPQSQAAAIMGRGHPRELSLVVRTSSEPAAAADAVRAEIAALDPDLPVASVATMTQLRARSLSVSRFAMLLLGAFSLLALVLGAVGIFGVISYLVARRQREIGIRLALGADPAGIVGLVLGQGMAPALAGIGLGVVAAFGLTRGLSSLLYGVTPLDPATFAAVVALFVGVAALACYFPARRAAAVDPTSALRQE
jgi:putative ABC transport system permease protein